MLGSTRRRGNRVEFRILGSLEVEDRGQSLPLGGHQQRALLALLLLHRFQSLLDEGRRALTAGDPDAAAATLRQALALWRGPPLPEFAFDSFAHVEIARLEELRLSALEERIEADLALGRHHDLIAELEALVSHNPLRERLRGQLMLAFYRSGRQAQALDAYQGARRMLVDELGIEPGQALQRLEKAILVQDATLELQPRCRGSRDHHALTAGAGFRAPRGSSRAPAPTAARRRIVAEVAPASHRADRSACRSRRRGRALLPRSGWVDDPNGARECARDHRPGVEQDRRRGARGRAAGRARQRLRRALGRRSRRSDGQSSGSEDEAPRADDPDP